jgi:methionyl-tRNA formyltransferase
MTHHTTQARSKKDLRIIFLGTPEFAVSSLHKMVEAGYNVVAVVTAPDKPAGRGLHIKESPVKKYATEKGILVLQPEKLKNPDFIQQLEGLHADLQVVVAFRMLPEKVWNMPPMGTINVHASLLPQYRGAAPINWAIINGEKESGVTTFRLKHEIDTGNILVRKSIPITEGETAGSLHDKLCELGATALLETLEGLTKGTLKEMPQNDEAILKHAPKIFPEICRINWDLPTQQIYQLINGLSPNPSAFTELEGKKLKIFSADKINEPPSIAPGNFKTDGKHFLHFATSDGYISVNELQLEGKKKMNIKDFLRGYHFRNPKIQS